MIKSILGRTGLEVSCVTYGGIVSTMGSYSGYTFDGDGQKESDRYVDYALSAGVNYFDVAPSYGDAQERLGNSLQGRRSQAVLACKTGERGYDGAAREFEQSMKLLHTDYFDVYQIHGICSMREVEQLFADDGAMKFLRAMREQGVIRHLGITGHNEKACLKALELYDYETVLFPFNWGMNMAIGYGSQIMKTAKERNLGIIGMKSMIERAFLPCDEAARAKFPKSWCKPFDPQTQPELLLAAMKYAWSLGINTLIPAGDFMHFEFAVKNWERFTGEPLTEREKQLLTAQLETTREHLFMPEDVR